MVRLDARLYAQIIEHVERERPIEACGLIAFDDDRPVTVYPGTNVLNSPTRYRMKDFEVLRAVDDMDSQGWWLGAIYHSHPSSPATPSATDLREASWPDALMIIVSLLHNTPELRAWRVNGQDYEEVTIEVRQPRLPWLSSVRKRGASRVFNPSGRRVPARSGWQPSTVMATSGSEPAAQALSPVREREDMDDVERTAVIGILGGMGPLATADLYRKIIETSPAQRDQEHFPVVIWADPRVPDRTAALLNSGEDPTPWLVRGGRKLAEMGADFIVIPCNTAHAFLPNVRPAVERPFLSMIDAAADEIRSTHPQARTVGLLATTGTISANLYQEALRQRGLDVIIPDDDVQERCVMAAIGDVKSGRGGSAATTLLVEASEHLTGRGAQVLLEACTEIPIALHQRHVATPILDATAALARIAVATAIHLNESARDGDPQWETSTTGWSIVPPAAASRPTTA